MLYNFDQYYGVDIWNITCDVLKYQASSILNTITIIHKDSISYPQVFQKRRIICTSIKIVAHLQYYILIIIPKFSFYIK